MKFTILKNKAKLCKLFRENGYVVNSANCVFTDIKPDFDLTEYFQSGAIKRETDRPGKKKRGAKKHETTRVEQIKKELNKMRNAYALSIAEALNRGNELYKSKYGGIDINSIGGIEHTEYLYAKSYGFPAKWKNAGVKVYPSEKKIRVYSYQGKMVQEFKLPKLKELKNRKIGDFGIPCAYAKRTSNACYKLFNHNDDLICLAKQMPGIENPDKKNWEHGQTIEQINAEQQHKLKVFNKEQKEKALSEKIKRATRLAKHLINDMCVTYADARAVGYCEAGVMNFINTHLDGKKEVKISILKTLSSNGKIS